MSHKINDRPKDYLKFLFRHAGFNKEVLASVVLDNTDTPEERKGYTTCMNVLVYNKLK